MTLDIVSSEGLVLGYTVAYYPVGSPYSLRERFFGPNATSFKLPALDPKTDYTVLLTVAFLGGLTATTNLTLNSGIEGAMEAVPGSVKSVSRQSVDSIPISWAPVPSTPQGPILGYNVRYQLISLGEEPVKDQPIHEINVTGTFLNLTNLEAFGSYRISVAAMNKKGIGPEIYFNAETCRCRKRLTTNWRAYVPYTDKSGLNGEPEGIIASVIREMSVSCCETCNTHGPSYVDFNSSWDYTGPAEVDNETALIDRISEHVDLTFPVYGTRDKTVYKPGFGFRALVESPGIAYVVRVDHNIPPYKLIVDSLINTLPFLAMTLLMAYIAGFVIWIMDRRQNMDEFPLSFIKGTYEGCWWAFITMTTLGYGDRVPRSRLAKACTIVWMLMGIVVFGILSGCLQSAVASITMKINSQLYGIKVLAIHNSPEYRLGIRLNSQVNTDVQPKNFEELFNALMAQKDNGALIDAYAIGSQKKLFQNPELTIVRILDLKIAYGIVLGGTSVRMKKCFYEYIHKHNERIFARIRKYVKIVEEAGNLPDSVEYSTGMFDAGTEMFRWTLYTLLGVLFVLLLIGITWERVWHIPRRKAIKESVEAQECTRAASEALKKEIELLLERMRAVRTRLCKKHANQTVAFLKKHKNKLLSLRMPERQARIENKFSALDKAHMKPKIGDFVF
ncbi:uncharacterized protein LOC125561016 [Nematostella vectensis]|uniref:uncharacterized protein LOC125561016 n=1 Tax=Nematostella vectensis TaxID=45351 RepID=UPI002076E0D4|nr:uncharacterized protein LOC125561016 [Nematostella vectensis]